MHSIPFHSTSSIVSRFFFLLSFLSILSHFSLLPFIPFYFSFVIPPVHFFHTPFMSILILVITLPCPYHNFHLLLLLFHFHYSLISFPFFSFLFLITPVLSTHMFNVWLCATPRTVAHQAPLSMGFSTCHLPNPGIEARSPALQMNSLLSEPPGKPVYAIDVWYFPTCRWYYQC